MSGVPPCSSSSCSSGTCSKASPSSTSSHSSPTLIWALWLLKVLLSRRYQPFTGEYHGTDERGHPGRRRAAGPVPRRAHAASSSSAPTRSSSSSTARSTPPSQEVSDEFAPLVRWVHTPDPRQAQRREDRHRDVARRDHRAGRLRHRLDRRHARPSWSSRSPTRRVGGVTTRQRILDPERSWITRWADWLENTRALYSMPAQSALGQVGCLPGRTIAFRRHILVQVMDDFMHAEVPGRVPRGLRRPDAHQPHAQGRLPDRLPVHEPRLHGRPAAGEEAGQAAAPLGPREPVQHPADAALDGRARAAPGDLLRRRHPPAVPAVRDDRRLDLPGRLRHRRQPLPGDPRDVHGADRLGRGSSRP